MKLRVKLFRSIWFWVLVTLVVVGLSLYLFKVRPWLMAFTTGGAGYSLTIAPADTYTYRYHASFTPLASVPYNLIGPVLFIKLFGGNFDLMFLFYVVLFCFVLRELYRYTRVRVLQFAVFFLANPLLMFNLFSPNKEILIAIALLFIVVYIHSRNIGHSIMAIVIAAFSKPEFLILTVFFLMSVRLRRKWRPLILFTIIVLISLFYSSLPNQEAYSVVLYRGQTVNSLGFTVLLEKLAANYYLYAMVIIPRLLLGIYEGGVLSIFFFLPVILYIILKSRIRIVYDEVFLLYLFLIMVSVISFPHYRYLLPSYPLLLFLALCPRISNIEKSKLV